MLFDTRSKNRPYELGSYPLEILERDDFVVEKEAARAPILRPDSDQQPNGPLAKILRDYLNIFIKNSGGQPATKKAPVPDDLHRRMMDVKGYCYFLNASQVGICSLAPNAWVSDIEALDHQFAIVVLLEHSRLPEQGNLAHHWIEPALKDAADCRIGGIAVCLAGHIKKLGFNATAHVGGSSMVDAQRLAVLAGLAVRDQEKLRNPFIDREFSLAIVTTDYALETDRPLAKNALKAKGLAYWLGQNGATSGRERNRRKSRPTHLGSYPMETLKRVDRPTTLILDEEVPQVPKRAAFFDRALRGDLGAKSQKERNNFAVKQPHTSGMMGPMLGMVAVQSGKANEQADVTRYSDPLANARAMKSFAHFMGADIVGICQVPRYAWYSHNGEGQPIKTRHKYAIVMVIDQEFDTMEGGSGDDWISGTQSMRAYLRGAEIAGVMAQFTRQLGFASRSQTNVDSDVLQLPLMLWAGLGELSRIGELVLNPFVGPRLKTVVMTTDMPLAVDRPIDFGLQYFCGNCLKCARECPCDAISWGDKIMFNAYEMWKPDVERCARYRLTNARGSACGRCMKTCPLNKVVTADGPLVERMASWSGINARFLKPVLVPIAVWLDDWLGKGKRNPVKKWWLDLEVVDGNCVEPIKGVNQRDLDLDRKVDPAKQNMAYYQAHMMPVPNDLRSQPVVRKLALAEAENLETPLEATVRQAMGEGIPRPYIPTPAAAGGPISAEYKTETYGGRANKR